MARACLRHGRTVPPRAPQPAAQQGQSLVELALLLPILLLVLLGAVNLGLILHTDTALAQVTQQATSYLLAHPADPNSTIPVIDPSNQSAQHCSDDYAFCTELVVANYLNAHGYSCKPLIASASCNVGVQFSLTNSGVQMDTLTVSEPATLIVPYPSWLHVGSLSATASTIAATALWSNPHVSGSSIQWTWALPFAAGTPITISYGLEEVNTGTPTAVAVTNGATATIPCSGTCPSTFHLTIWQANDLQSTCSYPTPTPGTAPATCRLGP
jgi:hypothetical protein